MTSKTYRIERLENGGRPFLEVHNLGNKRILDMIHRRIQLVNFFSSSRTNISCKNTRLELGTGDLCGMCQTAQKPIRRNEEPGFEDGDSRQVSFLNEHSSVPLLFQRPFCGI